VIDSTREVAPALCSGCGVCTSVCPNGVAITDIITIARARMVDGGRKLPLGQRLLNRPDVIGRLGGIAPSLANAVLRSRLLRLLGEHIVGVHRDAPLPRIHGPVFRRWLDSHTQPDGPGIAYFTGCAIENYDPGVGIAAVRLLNRLGYRVDAPSRACCALPMLSSGEWGAAEARADALINDLTPVAVAGQTIVSTSTSCSLTLRTKYAAYLDRTDGQARQVADHVVDICEFLRETSMPRLAAEFKPLSLRVLYHGPCQLRGHRMGEPALEILRLIPEMTVERSRADCCGVAGTYGYDRDKHGIANAVGRTLFGQVEVMGPDLVLCDSETCRWHIEKATGIPCRHPVEVIWESVDGSGL
jgi:glycerol-3-phosphate dehydrogenase subunit C